ncbi:MAG: hypothetical protein R3349_06620 [Geminicoccaceae bacterium]|nr:hypothetical protein [Geminicoccaceae bacterium]
MPSEIDPTFPADGTPVSKPAFRAQLLTLRAELEHGGFVTNPVTLAESTASQALADLHAILPAARIGTIAELQAIPPAPGLVIEVLGYHVPGDGGGGLFHADMSGARPTDGGIVFGHVGDESAEQVESGRTAGHFLSGFSLAQGNLAFGSLVISFAANSALTIPDLALHGHRSYGNAGGGIVPFVDHASGAISRINGLNGYLTARSTTATLTYKHLTDARRWVRVHDGRTLDVRWFGAVPGSTSEDERNRICWALVAAKRLGFTEVRLNGAYHYVGGIEIPAGVTFGWGKLTVLDGVALRHLANDYDTTHPDNLAVELLDGHITTVSPEDNAASWGCRKLELDGNYQNNTAALTDPAGYTRNAASGSLESELQNTPHWSGISAYDHGGRVIPAGQRAALEDVHVHGFGSNCIVGHGNTVYVGHNVRVGNSARNHPLYSVKGTFTHLTVYGFAWGSYIKNEQLTVFDLRFEDLSDFSNGSAGGFQPSWLVSSNLIFYEGLGWTATPNTSHRYQRIGVQVIGGHWDLAGWPGRGPLIYADGHHLTVQDVTILGQLAADGASSEKTRLFERSPVTASLAEDYTFRNVTMLNRDGITLGFMSDRDPLAALFTVENVSISYLQGYEGSAQTHQWFRLIADTPKNGQAAGQPRRIRMVGVTSTQASYLADVSVSDAAATPIEMTVRDCTLRFPDAKICRADNGTGDVGGLALPGEIDKIKLFFDTTRFQLQAGAENWSQAALFFALARFRGCTTFDGLVSEQRETIAVSASPTVVSTSLLWAPEAVRVVPMSSGLTDLWVEVYDSANATPIASAADKRSPTLRIHHTGSSGTLAWEAAVRPY